MLVQLTQQLVSKSLQNPKDKVKHFMLLAQPWYVNNKTPGYLRDILHPPTLLKKPFRRMEAFFLQNTLFFHHIFQLFQFFQKKPRNKVETHFQKKLQFETHLRKILPHVAILKKFKIFSETTHLFFRKKKQFSNVLRILFIPVAFYGKFATIW